MLISHSDVPLLAPRRTETERCIELAAIFQATPASGPTVLPPFARTHGFAVLTYVFTVEACLVGAIATVLAFGDC